MVHYIWQSPTWPAFTWDSAALLQPLGHARKAQGKLIADTETFELSMQAEVITTEAVTTAAIEGENLDVQTVRSSVARRLGLPTAGLPEAERKVEGLVEMLMDATRNFATPLTAARLKAWHAALFPTGYSGMYKIKVGDWRKGPEPMQVVSGPLGKERVHYLAPPSDQVPREMTRFLRWFRSGSGLRRQADGFIRAGLAHFWLVSIHPFQDGNGRIVRAVTDMALAQDEQNGCRLYSMSAQIRKERNAYYDILEQTQKDTGDITQWLLWFLGCLERAIQRSQNEVRKSKSKSRLWRKLAESGLNERQRKVVSRLFEAGKDGFEGGLTNRKYRGMTKTSRETAKRDLADLESKGFLVKNKGRGRSVSYDIVWSE